MTIEEAVIKYQETGCDIVFGEIYASIHGSNRKTVRDFTRKYRLDEADVESMINLKLVEVARDYDPRKGKFRSEVFRAIRYGSIDLLRKKLKEDGRSAEVMLEDDDGNSLELYEIKEVAPTTSEHEIIEEIQKKHDQRQLTAFLLSKVSEQTLTSALAFISTDSYRSAAKQIGTTGKTVKARIRNISKGFNSAHFGDYHDYLTVPTENIG